MLTGKHARLCLPCVLGSLGCHGSSNTDKGAATDECAYFACSTSNSTTAAINPPRFCKLGPEPGFSGVSYACAGEVAGNIRMDYFGAPELPVSAFLPCVEQQDGQPVGYVSTCIIAFDEEFGAASDARRIDACCLPDSPAAAVDPFCRIDAAEELCRRMFDTLEKRREDLPAAVPGLEQQLAGLNRQLVNLSRFLADADTRAECTRTVGEGLVSAGDFEGLLPAVEWIPRHPHERDPELGWPWFRGLRLNLNRFELDGFNPTARACDRPRAGRSQ